MHTGFSDNPSYEDARTIAAPLIERYEAGELDRVQLAYTRFITAGRQEVVVRALLPLADEDLHDAASTPAVRRTSSSPTPMRSSTACCRATPRRASTPRC